MNWEILFEFAIGAAAFSAALAYVGRKAVDAFFSARMEAHKAELQRLGLEHSVRFQKLHAERAEVIKDFYARLSVLDEVLRSTLRSFQQVGEEPLPEKVKRLGEQFNSVRDFFLAKRIFFEPSIVTLIDEILDTARGIFFDITTYNVDPAHPEYKYNREVLRERHEFWEKARTTHTKQFAELKAKLESQFRQILGIQDE